MGSFGRKPRRGRGLLWVAVIVLVAAAGWWTLRVGPAPSLSLDSQWPAIGRSNTVIASFSEPSHGLAEIRLELQQGDHLEVLDRQSFIPGIPLPRVLGGGRGTPQAVLQGDAGTDVQNWLAEGEAVIRAVAERSSGILRSPAPVVEERVVTVRRQPPQLLLVSTQHYARQGGSGAVVYRVGDTAFRSGVRAGTFEATGFRLPGGDDRDRFALYAIPWNEGDANEVRLFAEDDAGNRSELPFLDLFKPMPPRSDTIRIDDGFLERVVPAIASQTAGFDDSGSLLDQYLRINGDLRRRELERVAELSRSSRHEFLWSGPFLQMPNTALKANFAQTRTYLYDGSEVDRQTHLGLDLASTARAPVPAPNSGVVAYAGWMSLYGNAVVIDHGYGLSSLCGHLSTVEVAEGDRVERGQLVGTSGATGLAGGDHLHLEIFVQGQSVDPLEWLDGKWIRDKIASKIALP